MWSYINRNLDLALIPGTWHDTDFPKSPTPNTPIPLPQFRQLSFDPPTPAMSTTTMTDDDTPTSAYATPMYSIISLYPASPDAFDQNCVVDLFLASTSTGGQDLHYYNHNNIYHVQYTTQLPPSLQIHPNKIFVCV